MKKVIRCSAGAALLGLGYAAAAQTPTADLLKPPADARHFIIESTGGKHGDSYSWTAPDGTRMARESMDLRGQVWEIDFSGKEGADGMPAGATVRGVTPTGDAGEIFTVAGNVAQWKSPIDAGKAPYTTPAFYVEQGGPMDTKAWFLEKLQASPDHSMTLLPGGKAHADKLTSLIVVSDFRSREAERRSLVSVGHQQLTYSHVGRCQG